MQRSVYDANGTALDVTLLCTAYGHTVSPACPRAPAAIISLAGRDAWGAVARPATCLIGISAAAAARAGGSPQAVSGAAH